MYRYDDDWASGQTRYRLQGPFFAAAELGGATWRGWTVKRARQSTANKARLLRRSQLRGTKLIIIHPCTLPRPHQCPVSLIQDTMGTGSSPIEGLHSVHHTI